MVRGDMNHGDWIGTNHGGKGRKKRPEFLRGVPFY